MTEVQSSSHKVNLDRVVPVVGDAFLKQKILCIGHGVSMVADNCSRLGAEIILCYGPELDGDMYGTHWSVHHRRNGQTFVEDLESLINARGGTARIAKSHDEITGVTMVIAVGALNSVIGASVAQSLEVPLVCGAVTRSEAVAWMPRGGNGYGEECYRGAREVMQAVAESASSMEDNPVRAAMLQDSIGWMVKYQVLKNYPDKRVQAMEEYARSGRNTAVRSVYDDPFTTWWRADDSHLVAALRKSSLEEHDQSALKNAKIQSLKDKHVLMLGCGTGTLYLGMLSEYVKKWTLVDFKPFSTFNVVRQDIDRHIVDNEVKPFALLNQTMKRINPKATWVEVEVDDDKHKHMKTENGEFVHAINAQPSSPEDVRRILSKVGRPDLVVLATGRTQDTNHVLSNEFRKLGIPVLVPSALPGALYHKLIAVVPGANPCYSCVQGRTVADKVAPVLSTEARELYYGGTQPATMFETLPSANALMVVSIEMLAGPGLWSPWFRGRMSDGENCFLFANVVQKDSGVPKYGLGHVGNMVSFGPGDMNGWPACRTCGQMHGMPCFEDELCKLDGCESPGHESLNGYCGYAHLAVGMANEAAAKHEATIIEESESFSIL